jgi:hypothetical protein
MNLGAIRQREARVVLMEHRTEDLHCLQHTRRRQRLLTDRQHAVACEGVDQLCSDGVIHRLAEVNPQNLGAEVVGKRDDVHGCFLVCFLHVFGQRSPDAGSRHGWHGLTSRGPPP